MEPRRSIEVRPATAVVGAELVGVDLTGTLDDETVGEIRAALDRHLVVFLRDQPITPAQHLAFARRFGAISVAPFGPKHPDNPEVTVLDQQTPKGEGADNWHTDNTFMASPPMGSILRAVQLPSLGGDTLWASMYAAYEALSSSLQRMLDGLHAAHDLTAPLTRAIADGNAQVDLRAMQAAWPPVVHPVVRTNPADGRRALFVNGNFTTRIVELGQRENQALLPFLVDWVRSPEFQVRLRWEPDTIAFWDNRWAQHFAVPDYRERRIMHRVTIAGDAPV